jgi:hypothetical protein
MENSHPDQAVPAEPAGAGHPGPRTPRRARRVAVAAAAFVALAGAASGAASGTAAMAASGQGATPAVQPMRPGWHIVKQVRSGPFGGFTAVVAVGRSGGWAFDQGSVPTAWRRSGSTWTQVRFPGRANEVVVAAGASSATNVWAFTADGGRSRALRWNGRSWTVQRSFAQQVGGAVVLSPSDVWVFGQPDFPGSGLGAWHYDGHTWSRVASGHGLQGGSALSAGNIWAFDGSAIAHWNGSTWSRTSVAYALPPRQQLNDPMLTGIYAQSKDSVYAIANGGRQDEGGPTVILHWDGYQWYKVAEGNFGFGTQPLQQVSSDGHGGLWLPMPGVDGQRSYLVHYTPGHPLTEAPLPGGPNTISVGAVAAIPGTTDLLGGGDTHAYGNLGRNVVAVLLQYGI